MYSVEVLNLCAVITQEASLDRLNRVVRTDWPRVQGPRLGHVSDAVMVDAVMVNASQTQYKPNHTQARARSTRLQPEPECLQPEPEYYSLNAIRAGAQAKDPIT